MAERDEALGNFKKLKMELPPSVWEKVGKEINQKIMVRNFSGTLQKCNYYFIPHEFLTTYNTRLFL